MTRRWLERGVIVIAMLASIATSPRRWRREATQLPAIPDALRTTRVVIHASTPPTIELLKDSAHGYPRFTELGHGDYEVLVSPGWSLGSVYVDGRCKMHMLCGSDHCEPPPDTVVAVTSATPVATWHLEAATPEMVTELDPKLYSTTLVLRVPTTRPITIKVDTAAGEPVPSTVASRSEAEVFWRGVPTATTVHWTAHVSIDGPCPGVAPCEPPPGEELAITSIDRGFDAPR